MLKCVIFDLDGVLVSTDELHYQAWKAIADQLGVPFDRSDNMRQRGVSRMESLEVVLEKSSRSFTEQEKLALAQEKNELYRRMLSGLGPDDVLEGVRDTLAMLAQRGVVLAVGSSSKNAPEILERTQLAASMDTVVSGLDITHSKPHPEVFCKAGQRAGVRPEECLVVEDAATGVQAGKAAGMKVLAVGAAKDNAQADFRFAALSAAQSRWDGIFAAFEDPCPEQRAGQDKGETNGAGK